MTSTSAEPRVGIAGYSHLTQMVTDLERSKHFYGTVLGFEELPRPDFGGFGGVWYRVGDAQLHLGVVDELPPKGKGLPHFAVYIPPDKYHETVEALKAAGVPFLREPVSRVDFGRTVWAAFITDPDGHAIELTDVGPPE
jgi:catechol 2,3-dioxygenase-like lactoylglutathione lyase family enzyme